MWVISYGVTPDGVTASFIGTDQGKQRVAGLRTLQEFHIVWIPPGYMLTQPPVQESTAGGNQQSAQYLTELPGPKCPAVGPEV